MSTPLSRRTFLQTSGTAGLGLFALSTAGPARATTAATAASDDFATIRSQWATVIGGGSIDATNPVYATAFATMNSQAASYLALLESAPTTQLFSDLALGSNSANVTGSFTRLETLALVYVTPGTNYTGSAAVLEAVVSGLDYLAAGPYAPSVKPYGNWWDWQIGSSQPLVDAANLVYSSLSTTQIANYCASIDAFVPDPTQQLIIGSGYTTSTGANRLDECRAVIVRGALAGDAAKVTQGVAGISPTLTFVTTGDGLYADGSWVQHGSIAYTGTYGAIWFGDVVKLMSALAGTTYQIADPNVANVFFAATNGFAPVSYNGLMLDAVRGRAISRSTETDYNDGFGVIHDLLMLAAAAPSSQLEVELKARAKGWLQRSPYPLSSSTAVANIAYAEQVLSDNSIPAAPEPVGHTLYSSMDRAIHRRRGWAAAISMASDRIAYYETGNGENLQGWHTGDGMTYLYLDDDNTQYDDAFWPTVDRYRLPGTTASLLPLQDAQGGAWGNPHPSSVWTGGASDGEYAAIGQDLQGPFSTLRAKKSWFCLDDAIVCLGAGITATDGYEVDTVIDNRNLGAAGTNTLTIDGKTQPGTRGWTQIFANVRWVQLENHAGYVFPQGTTITALREARTGKWRDISAGEITTPQTRDYVTLYADHGTDPTNAYYTYILMPRATRSQVLARSADREYLRILTNTAHQQGIEIPSLGLIAVNFYTAGTVGPIAADGPASVLTREHRDGTATICVSDPTRQDTSLTVTWNRPVRRVTNAPETLTASETGRSLRLCFSDLTGQAGRTQQITATLA